MKNEWRQLILKNFGNASLHYNSKAYLQRKFAAYLAKECSKQSIQNGLWVDLGCGTGLLADALEALHPNQAVARLDGSQAMLNMHSSKKETKLWDLNNGLPEWSEAPSLLASNFVLHWLCKPEETLESWLNALAPKGWLAITLPIRGCFHEWHEACSESDVQCTALEFPKQNSILKVFNPKMIHTQKVYRFSQQSDSVTSLLKSISKLGAQSTPKASLSVGDLRRLQKAWPRHNQTKRVNLTWLIQLLLVQR